MRRGRFAVQLENRMFPPAAGHLLAGRYRIEALIGRGGMAEVYRGRDERLGRPVALKVLTRGGDDESLRRRFRDEARAAAMVSHPNVIAVYDAGEDDEQAFIVMELVIGSTLAEQIDSGPMNVADVRRIGSEILEALAAAHERGVLHRDIKPANVLLTEDGTAKVADFGIAKAVNPTLRSVPDGGEPTALHVVLGTPSYLAPERVRGKPATVASDLWSVGAVLYEALTGSKPYEADSPIAVALAAEKGEHTPLIERRPDLDAGLVGAVERSLQPDPDARYASAAQMGRAVRGETGDETAPMTIVAPLAAAPTLAMADSVPRTAALAARRPVGAAPTSRTAALDVPAESDTWHTRTFRRRHTALVAAAAAALVALGLTGAALASGGHSRPPAPAASKHHTHTTTPPTLASSPSPSTTMPATTTTAAPKQPAGGGKGHGNPHPGGPPGHQGGHGHGGDPPPVGGPTGSSGGSTGTTGTTGTTSPSGATGPTGTSGTTGTTTPSGSTGTGGTPGTTAPPGTAPGTSVATSLDESPAA